MGMEIPHGTRVGYACRGCRCFACRVANTDYETARQADLRRRAPWRLHYTQEIRAYCVRNQLTGDVALRAVDGETALRKRDSLNRQAAAACEAPTIWATPAVIAQVRRRIAGLAAVGIGFRQLGRATGVRRHTIADIARGESHRADRPRNRKVRNDTARRILAAFPKHAAPGARVPAEDTNRMIQELLDFGITRRELAARLGSGAQRPHLQIGSGASVLQKTEDRVRGLHDVIWRSEWAFRSLCKCSWWEL